MKYSRRERQNIVDAFMQRHGIFTRSAFLDEVEAEGESHPAWAWFTWDDSVAARAYRLREAGEFVQSLRVRVQVLTSEPRRIKVVEQPYLISPVEDRARAGGYHRLNLDREEDRVEMTRQAAQSLETWFRRYEAMMRKLELHGDADAIASTIQTLQWIIDGEGDPPAIAAE